MLKCICSYLTLIYLPTRRLHWVLTTEIKSDFKAMPQGIWKYGKRSNYKMITLLFPLRLHLSVGAILSSIFNQADHEIRILDTDSG